MLWGVWMTANIRMWMHDVAAAWSMTSLTTSLVMVALVQSASVLPVLLLGLSSGAGGHPGPVSPFHGHPELGGDGGGDHLRCHRVGRYVGALAAGADLCQWCQPGHAPVGLLLTRRIAEPVDSR
jgi:Transmembrane secretion effector